MEKCYKDEYLELLFESSPGEYIIDDFHNEIASKSLMAFKGGKFNTTTEVVDAIQVNPNLKDTFSLWKIIIIKGN